MQIERQVELAQADIDSGNAELALTRAGWVLERDPNNARAQAISETAVQAAAAAQATPTPTAAVPTPTPALPNDDSAETTRTDLASVQTLIDNAAWEDAVSAILEFRADNPDVPDSQTDGLLFDAYLALGMQLARSDRIELGLTYLEQAEALGTLPQEALDQQVLSQLYLNGLGYYGVRWDVAIPNFQQICDVTPFYLDSCERLVAAKEAYGDQWAFADEYCPAATWYTEAILDTDTAELAAKLTDARAKCAAATPTPEPTPEQPEGAPSETPDPDATIPPDGG